MRQYLCAERFAFTKSQNWRFVAQSGELRLSRVALASTAFSRSYTPRFCGYRSSADGANIMLCREEIHCQFVLLCFGRRTSQDLVRCSFPERSSFVPKCWGNSFPGREKHSPNCRAPKKTAACALEHKLHLRATTLTACGKCICFQYRGNVCLYAICDQEARCLPPNL